MEEIDYMSMSLEELNQKLQEFQKKSSDFYNTEQGIKLTLNSIYGATGNQYFALFNPDVAESVTLQGQDIWKFAEKIVNRYFNEMWHLDTELHEKMGVTNVRKLTMDFIIYGDTDSNYINLGAVMDSCEFNYDAFDFVKKLNDYRLKEYIKKCYEIYAKKWNTDNYQDFELESLSYSGIFLGKKK
jgi:DNA polymerase elongation subunit (family B)